MNPSVIDVFTYDDYRELLSDYYLKKKDQQPTFSYRAFARRTGFRAPNHLQRVILGDRNLTLEAAVRYAEAMGLDAEEQEYFCVLVECAHVSEEERPLLEERRRALIRYRKAKRLDAAYAAYHSHWYIPVIFDLVSCEGFVDDPAWIAPHMRPEIAVEEAALAMRVLRELHLIKEVDGRLVPVEPVLTTGAEARRKGIADYHRSMIARGSDAIENIPSDERDISALTLCVSEESMARLKERLREFRKELLSIDPDEGGPKQVVQLNLQLFPLTRVVGAEKYLCPVLGQRRPPSHD